MKKIYLLFLPLFLFLVLQAPTALLAQDPPQYGTPFTGVPDPRDASIYQVNMRAFSSTHDFQGVINRLDQIKALGVNVVYLMPIYPVGTLKSVNSPYCIRSFDSVGTEFGTLTDLRNLVDGAHSRGMAVILDFVVNQTSWDHPWITQHPDWYLRDGNGNIEQLGSYTDVAALNFASTAMRSALVTSMRGWIFRANVDGFRCDFADNPPIDFWDSTISNLRGITTHKLLMLAEGTRSANYGAGFDYNYGMQFYFTTLKDIFGGSPVTEIDNSNTVEYSGASGTNQIARYLTNHDVDGSDGSPVTLFGGKAGNLAAFVVIAYMKGVPFIYNGTEVAFPTAITFPFTSVVIDWTLNPDQVTAYTNILSFRNSSNAIRRGTLVSYDNNDVAAFTKTAGSETVAVLSNLRNSTIAYSLPAALQNTTWTNAFTGAAITLGTTLSLTAYQYMVLTNQNVPTVPVTGVTVSPASATVNAGLTTQLTATVSPANATNQHVSWSSSNTAVATVSATGLVTAVAAGTATITATTADGGKTSTAAITVNPASGFTVYFYPPTGWGSALKIYWWDAQPAGVLADGTWPGVAMTNDGNGWYSYTFTNITSTNLIFNDGSNQTANLARGSNGWYQNGTWYDTNPGAATGTTYYQIINRWQANTYLYDGGNGKVLYGTNPSGNAYQWAQVAGPTGYVYLQNRATGNYMHVQDQTGAVECGSIQPSWYSAMWSIADAGGGWSYLENRWQANQWVHIEHLLGYAEYAGAQTGWYSAMWQFVNPVTVSSTDRTTQTARATALSQDSLLTTTVKLFPNPVQGGAFYISMPSAATGDPIWVSVTDIAGRTVYTTQLNGPGWVTHVFPAGVYFVRIRNRGVDVTKKIVVE
jgi:glycosidase